MLASGVLSGRFYSSGSGCCLPMFCQGTSRIPLSFRSLFGILCPVQWFLCSFGFTKHNYVNVFCNVVYSTDCDVHCGQSIFAYVFVFVPNALYLQLSAY